jgi:Ca2+-binding EF-hand superfamily protein
MDDLHNIKKAFNSLDVNKTGVIQYDINRIPDSKNFILNFKVANYKNLKYHADEGIVEIDFKQFMDIMTDNILSNRRKFDNKIIFESGNYN